ncbi:MAG TPA: MBL fold metallo-hydrolase [Gaiellaceae bacterium]|jgi:glyoxylase-like metal-dependent hydrolase (beta-lactamase superfamily II)
MEHITDSIHHLPDVMGGPTLLVDEDEVVVIDTGVPGAEADILAALTELGREPQEVRHVLITHADGDHVGGLAALVAATGARVYASEHEADVIEGRAPARSGETREWGRVDERVRPGEKVSVHGGVEVVDTAGHTLGHVAYFLPREGVLVAGDCVNNREGLAGSPPQLTADADQARKAVRTIAVLAPRTLCMGHGPSLVGDAAEQLAELDRTL